MTIEELTKKARENKSKALEKAKADFITWCKSLYKDCEDDIKEDKENPPFVFPENYTAFDLFIDNLVELISDTEKFMEIGFIEKAESLHKIENTDIKEYFY